MKTLRQALIIVAGAALGLMIGFALRNKMAATTLATSERSPSATRSTSNFNSRSSFLANRRGARADDSPLATQLERDLSMSSGVTRWLHWLEALEKAKPSDCPRLAQLAQGNATLVRLVAARWVEMDPKHMFETIVAGHDRTQFPVGELQRVLFDEWPKRDLEAVIAALSHTNAMGLPENWRRSFAATLVEKDPERGLRLMSEWNVENHGPRMTGVKKWAAANPRHAAEFALAHPAGYATRLTMETIGKEWARTEPAAAMEFSASRRGEFASTLASSVLKSWAERNLDEASAWLAKTDLDSKNRLSPAFVEAWGKYDAASALKWCEGNLTGVAFANAAAGLVKGAAAGDVIGAADLVTAMAPSRARAEAASALMEKWLPEYSSDKPTPPEAVAWLTRLDAETIQRVLEQVHWRWADVDPKGLAALIKSIPAEQVPAQAYYTLARHMARQNPIEALAWANQLSEAQRSTAGNNVFEEWQRAQPEAARQWLRELPANDPRRAPFFQSFISTMAYDVRATDWWSTLDASEQTAARAVIEKLRLPDDQKTALLNKLKPR